MQMSLHACVESKLTEMLLSMFFKRLGPYRLSSQVVKPVDTSSVETIFYAARENFWVLCVTVKNNKYKNQSDKNEGERKRERESKNERKYLNWREGDERLEKNIWKKKKKNEESKKAKVEEGGLLSSWSFVPLCTHIYTHSLSIFLTAELKMEILRERELRESIEKQMMEDQRSRGKLFSVHHSFSFRYIFEYLTLLTGCAYI